jgi:hypothetical protein
LDTATLILLACGIGLLLLLIWTMYRIQHHRKKMNEMDRIAIDVGKMSKEDRSPGPRDDEHPPTLPEKELLIVMYRNRKRPWRGVVNSRIKEGKRVLVISPRPPKEMKRLYPNAPKIVWLDRSTAHDLDGGTTVVNPTNLSSLLEEIRSYLGKGPRGGTVVFEGFEEIISGNELNRVIRFLSMLKQTCREISISAVVPLPYRAIPQRTRNQLTEVFESVVIG